VLILSDRPGMMVSPKAIEESADGSMDRAPVGAGAWKFVSWTDNSEVVVTRNEDYWRPGRPYLDGIEFSIIPETNTGLRSVVAGENDLAYALTQQQLTIVERADTLDYVTGPTQILNMLYFNLSRPTIGNLQVRQALNHAVNREALNAITQDGEPAFSVIPSVHWAYNPAVTDFYPYDPDRARALLAEAGFPDGFKVTLFSPSDRYPNDAATAQAIAQMWTRAGVKTAVETLPWSAYTGRGGKQEFGIGLWGWGSPTGEAGYLLSNVAATNDAARGLGVFNYGRYSNPELDKQIVEALATIDDDKREKLFVSAIEIFAKTLPIIPLYTLDNAWVTRKGITIEPRRDERTLAVDARPAK
jgi:peptide/nickel transport system substrate-binding protein